MPPPLLIERHRRPSHLPSCQPSQTTPTQVAQIHHPQLTCCCFTFTHPSHRPSTTPFSGLCQNTHGKNHHSHSQPHESG
eukprot:scaffold325755_cov142-Cyclotella_meneghiniana.AAC.1